jgi:hypothetical protein
MLRPQTISFINDNLERLSPEQRDWVNAAKDEPLDSDRIGPIMADLGILDHPDNLSWTVLQSREGTEYVIEPGAARSLASGDELVQVRVLGGEGAITTRTSSRPANGGHAILGISCGTGVSAIQSTHGAAVGLNDIAPRARIDGGSVESIHYE